MEYNIEKKRAADVYLLEKWHSYAGTPSERRSTIFQEFVKLGMRKRWEWHKLAETYVFDEEDKAVLEQCRTWKARAVAYWISANDGREIVLLTTDRDDLDVSETEPGHRTAGEVSWYYCEYSSTGSPFGTLPEIAYSMTMFDDPEDVKVARVASIAEARSSGRSGEPDQSLWVSGVFHSQNRVVWVDEFGETIREKRIDGNELGEDAELFEEYRPFETSWWLEAERVGNYARDEWWV